MAATDRESSGRQPGGEACLFSQAGGNMAGRKKEQINWVGYLFILPGIIFFAVYILYPILFVGWNSLFQWSTQSRKEFVGLWQFQALLKDKIFFQSIKNAFLWIAVTVPIQGILGFLLAFAIEERLRRRGSRGSTGKQVFFRTLFFIPVVISVTVVAIIFSKIWQPYQGIIGYYLHRVFGVSPTINVLGEQHRAIFGIMLANIWEWTGWSMIMYVGGISQVPGDMIEAAKIDGATVWQELRYIYIPSLLSVHKSLLMLGIIGSLQTYALVSVMTNGGPNHASQMPGTYIFFKGFTQLQMGYACAISMMVLLLALVLTFVQVKFLGSGDFIKHGAS